MNYITEIKAFQELVQDKQLSSGQIALWYTLMYINNRCAWQEWFTASALSLQLNSGLSRQGIIKSRNALKQLGIIDFKSNGTRAASYKLTSLMSKSVQAGLQDGVQDSVQVSIQSSVQDSSALNKPNQTKPNNNKKINKKDADEFFDSIWQLYPEKKGKGQVKEKQRGILFEIGYEHIKRCIDRYLAGLKKDSWRKPQNGSTFFNSGYVDYLDENYTQPETTTYKSPDDSEYFFDEEDI